MAKKSFVLSNGDGRVTWTNIDSASIEDGAPDASIRGHVSASNLYISSSFRVNNIVVNAPWILTASLLSSSGGTGFVTSSLTGTTALSGCVGWNGSNYVVTNVMDPSDYGGIPVGTWISGNYQENSRVVNINTVSSGSLKPAYGGTGLTGSQYAMTKNLILKGSGSAPTAFSALSASASGTIIASGEGRFAVQFPSYKPDVRFYSSPGTYTWTRPIGARFARVILQGAGGGGGGGAYNGSNGYGGCGGGSGGFSDIVLDISNIIVSTIIIGVGGSGGTGATNSTLNSPKDGSDGGNTSWTDLFSSYISYGGSGGARGHTNSPPAGGTGITKNGGYGGYHSSTTAVVAPETTYGMPSGGGKGYGQSNTLIQQAGGTIIPIINPANKNFGYDKSTDSISLSTNLITGSTGAINGGTALDATLGAGGGGGYATITAKSNGSRGGDGYALIISW